MRLGLLIRDIEYRDAFIERLSNHDSDIFLDVIDASSSVEPDALILTDAKPAELGDELIEKIKNRTVFLTNQNLNPPIINCNLHKLFKYSGFSRLLADISEIYCEWQGSGSHRVATSKLIACCADSDAFSHGRCAKLGSEIIYTHGGSLLILPLGYINEDSIDFKRDINSFARLMYMVKSNRLIDASGISYTDSYGVSRLYIPRGRNPIAYLDMDDLEELIMTMSKLFNTVILDIGTCYREENLKVIKNVDSLLCLETGQRRMNFSSLLSSEDSGRMRVMKIVEDSIEAFAMDEYIRELYYDKSGEKMQ